jgi:hypothetical protein
VSGARTFARRLWNGWLAVAARFGEAQTLTLMGLVYAFVIGPAALGTRLAGRDLLDKRRLRLSGSAWREPDSRPAELDNLKQPF